MNIIPQLKGFFQKECYIQPYSVVTAICYNIAAGGKEAPQQGILNGLQGLRVALDAHAPLYLVVLQLRANELKDHFNLNAGMIARGMEMLVRECAISYYGYPAPKVLLIAPAPTRPDIATIRTPSSLGPMAYRKSCELGKLYKAIAERHHCGFIDCAELNFELNAVDGLHYSIADHAKLVSIVTERIREMLD